MLPTLRPLLRRRTVLTGALSLGALAALGTPGRAWAADAPEITDCDSWGARQPTSPVRVLPTSPEKIVVHHTATPNVADYSQKRSLVLARAIQNYQMDTNGWIDTGQHFTVSRGGFVTEGRHESLNSLLGGSETVEAAHCTGQNRVAIGIENEGTYSTVEPRTEQYESLVALCTYICRQYGVDAYQIYGHRDFNATACPGDRLYALLPKLRSDVAARVGGDPVGPMWTVLRPGDTGERVRILQHLLLQHGAQVPVDGSFGPATESALRAFQTRSETVLDGVAGAQTWNQLSTPVSQGAAGQAVRAMQGRLHSLGYDTPVDGLFGPGTRSRVAAFQKARRLPADGSVDARTWSRLLA
ncbi:N-acetylmuramoyl-L-alanine amidase [Streptomyces sp. NPDC101118]|uniref:peptidoglycan recognition protein family protein n=1 Tax=Streptomyces sp. NPDC101118 TaxID=3366109 RepID=UPI00380C82A5